MASASTGADTSVSTTRSPRTARRGTKFPYGDFGHVHRCGVLAAENRAAQRKYFDIESAAAHLHGVLDALRIG
jgi:hypothetical protein